MNIKIPIKCPSWNSMYAGRHWSKRAEEAQEIHDMVVIAAKQSGIRTYDTCWIEYRVYYKGKRRHDADNCCVKYFTDGLVSAGVIKDDNSEIVKGILTAVKTGGKEDFVLIRIGKAGWVSGPSKQGKQNQCARRRNLALSNQSLSGEESRFLASNPRRRK